MVVKHRLIRNLNLTVNLIHQISKIVITFCVYSASLRFNTTVMLYHLTNFWAQIQTKIFQIASQTIEISLMTLFMHHYGWTQMSKGRSWNPLKTMKSTQKGLRMIYDSYMEAIMRRRNSCIQWILFGFQC